MAIKQKIIIAFTLIVAAILVLFSFFVYYSYEDYRAELMKERLFGRAEATKKLLATPRAFKTNVFFPLTEQYEAVYDEENMLLVCTQKSNDFIPDQAFFKSVRLKKRFAFTYISPLHDFDKEGVAITYRVKGKPYLALVTGYDLHGYNMSRTLRFSLFFGNLLALLVIGVTGYFFSRKAMSPFDDLIRQIDRAAISDFSFRINHNADVNEATVLAKSFNQLLKKIQQLADNQRSFISYASHEIRTPLTVIKGVLQTSLAYDRHPKDYQTSVGEALGGVNHAIELANNLLLLAEIESLQFFVNKKNISIVDLIMDCIGDINQKYSSQVIHFQFIENSAVVQQQAVAEGIPHLLKSAIGNVIDNACKYSAFQPITILITEQQEFVVIVVRDQGIGILPEDLEDIFLPMMRGSNTGQVTGFGIGLTLVRKIVEFHGGFLAIESQVSKGTAVSLHLPKITF
ncbi:signal transduction histidine kinase [Dyadobacter sp. BE34]|uniref:histidine kinase n=1 Tax=Dyadobacter fermentans TaxID=94254 RepID=A0ABU1R878_9BACT|nr:MULTISPECIES: HAMP domain-containing sensor histidine kinase [Dyadobacter]MDR6809609.1 signal transduction histidine kinase [Dyadobacter fermentans]MDR7047287.1 signal transduction histidine kinase [Dyadobacter sp. BE242]MDR7201523.1 signal transduction histidine kinase [Dyadobacter sp. BE34]MDR7219393.1 signal transduction histidine kinase [Dyadobacter sp. BE31]MDR7267213.1 signal transduction histidine kinase [Dyadobacter sp. BE32]